MVGTSNVNLPSSLIVTLDGAVVGGMILMIEAAGGVRKRSKETAWGAHVGVRRRLQGFVGLVIFCVFFLLILYVFKNKVKNYRFRLVRVTLT